MLIVSCCKKDKEIFIAYADPNIAYQGRIDTSRIDAAELYWSGTSIKINFRGDSIAALLRESRGDNYYNVIIDSDSFFIFRPDTLKKYYTLATDLSSGRHTVELFKRTEWDRGTGEFNRFRIGGKAKVEPKAPELLSNHCKALQCGLQPHMQERNRNQYQLVSRHYA